MKTNKKRSFLCRTFIVFFVVFSLALTSCQTFKTNGGQALEETSYQADQHGMIPLTKPSERILIKTKSVLYVKERVNLRKGPTNQSKVLVKIPTGSVFTKVDKGERWTKVQYKNHIGYVLNGLLFEAKLSMADDLIIVNKGLPLPKDFDPGYNQESLNQMNRLLKEAKQNGFSLHIVSSYRSIDDQKRAYRKNVKNLGQERADLTSARPGYSEHQTGLAYDVAIKGSYRLTSKFGDSEEGRWIAQNAPRFGFILRYPKGKEALTGYLHEPWHFRYIGSKAQEITESGLTLDEYFDAIYQDYRD